MKENRHTLSDLFQMQSLPLSAKIRMTEARIQVWINEFGTEGVAISFSGGKDSTVLMDIIRNRMNYKDIPAVFVDVPTQFPELKQFALTWDNVEVLKPKISFTEVCDKYGFPLISKEVAETIHGARSYYKRVCSEEITEESLRYVDYISIKEKTRGGYDRKWRKIRGINEFSKKNDEIGDKSMFSQEKYKFLVKANFDLSQKCCDIMKKDPAHRYTKQTGRHFITGSMADESRLRKQMWLQNGCNVFDAKEPISNPMSFWTDQDVLQYIKENNLPICSVYGDVIYDWENSEDVQGQLTISDIAGFEEEKRFDADKPLLKTTGCKRTGCMLCGFGCHLEKPGDGRFELLKKTHPGMYKLLDVIKNNGVTMREAIEWINKNGGFDIKL